MTMAQQWLGAFIIYAVIAFFVFMMYAISQGHGDD